MNRHWSTKHKNITCAEDIVLIADNEQDMQNVVNNVIAHSQQLRIKVNCEKT